MFFLLYWTGGMLNNDETSCKTSNMFSQQALSSVRASFPMIHCGES